MPLMIGILPTSQYSRELDTGWLIQPGIRYSSVRANLKKFYQKNSDSFTLFDPEIKTYDEIVGSIRANPQAAQG